MASCNKKLKLLKLSSNFSGIFALSYHQKVPDELPELEIKATYGLAKPEDFTAPMQHELWTPDSYHSFDITKAATPDFSVIF